MKSLTSKIALLTVISLSMAFVPTPGGEGFEIFLNNKVIIQQFGPQMKEVKTLELSNMQANDRLTVKYSHCGRNGNQRVVSVRNAKSQVLRSFSYPDTKTLTTMEVPLNEILKLKAQNLHLYYSSSELTSAKLLVSLKRESGVAIK